MNSIRYRNKTDNMSSSNNINLFLISLALLTIRTNCYTNSPIFLPRHSTTSTNRKLSSLAYQDERYASSSSSSSATFSTNRRRTRSNNNGGSLEQRLRDMYKQDQKKQNERRHSVVKVVHTLDQFKKLLAKEGKDKIVIVRFYANWCKACKATTPYYYSLANRHNESTKSKNSICFVDVPITDKNVDLHQGLGIPSIPYGHIYIPDNKEEGGLLVEEFRMMKKVYKNHKVQTLLNWYAQGYCNLKIEDEEDEIKDEDYCTGPYCMLDDDDDENEQYTKL